MKSKFFITVKDLFESKQCSGLVDKIPREDCSTLYVSETKLGTPILFRERIKEQMENLCNKEKSTDQICTHLFLKPATFQTIYSTSFFIGIIIK